MTILYYTVKKEHKQDETCFAGIAPDMQSCHTYKKRSKLEFSHTGPYQGFKFQVEENINN